MAVLESLRKIVVIASLAAGPVGAQAALYSWDAHAPLEAGAGFVLPGNFADYWTFTIDQAMVRGSSVVVANNNPPFYRIAPGAGYGLYGAGVNGVVGGGDDLLLGSWSFDGSTGQTVNSINLSSGSYFFSVTGTATGAGGGLYTISSELSPVPTPESFGLLAAGLGMIGLMARRRRNARTGDRHGVQ